MANGSSSSNGKPNIGPGDLKPQGDDPFLLSKPEFLAVQTYVNAGALLPASRTDMQNKLGIAQEDIATFDKLISAYSAIVTHCSYFNTTTFPMSVQLAADVTHYNTKVPIYYGALNPIIDAWQNGVMKPDQAQAKLSAVLGNLRDTAKGYSDTAATVKAKMIQFVEETKNDRDTLTPIKEDYHNQLTGEQGEIQTYLDQIKNDADNIKTWNAEYEHDCVVAGTAATYAWLFPFGTIAAGIVAGIYGKKATDALDRVHEYQEKLDQAQENLRRALNLLYDLNLADDSLSGILDKLNAALPVLEKMEGIWGALADDMTNILNVIDQGIDRAPAIIKDLGVLEAIADWDKVAKIADSYRANAYISFTTEDEIKANPEKYDVKQAVKQAA